jgi:hypothetical protein
VGPRVGLDTMEKKKILHIPGIEPQPSRQPVAVSIPTDLSQLLAVEGVVEKVRKQRSIVVRTTFLTVTCEIFLRLSSKFLTQIKQL